MRVASLGTALASICLVIGAMFSAAPANASCAPPGAPAGSGQWTDGWYETSFATLGGIRAKLENYAPLVFINTTPTTMWVMLTRTDAPVYAQVGWMQQPLGFRNTFLQVRPSMGAVTTRMSDPPQTLGTTPYYTVLYNNTPGKFTFEVNGSAFPFSGYTVAADFVPNHGQIFGEIQDQRNQMPGSQADDVSIFQANKWMNGSWVAFSGTPTSSNFSNWRYDGPYSGVDLYIWDNRCLS